MTWREIMDMYLGGAGSGGSPDDAAANRAWDFLNEANRRLHAALDEAECFRRVAVETTPNQDWIPSPDRVYSVRWIQNRTGGHKLRKEPEGMLGRSRFFASGTDKPPTGEIESVNFYTREEDKIWLRDTPNEIGVLDISFKFIPEKVTDLDLDDAPILPEQYHFTLAELAVAMYYKFYPPLDPATGVPLSSYGNQRIAGIFAEMDSTIDGARAEENLDHTKTVYQRGYQMGGIR